MPILVWPDQPAALTEFLGTVHNRTKVNLAAFTDARLSVWVQIAGSANARIFPLTQAGREEYVRASKAAYCNWFNVQTQAAKDAECTKVGLLVGCPCLAQ